MLSVTRGITPYWYQVSTGEAGIKVAGRIKLGKFAFDPIYGMRMQGSAVDFTHEVFKHLGLKFTVPMINCTNVPPRKKLLWGRAYLNDNMVIIYRHTLGMLVHEVSHIVAWNMFRDDGHREGFKASYQLMHMAANKLMGFDVDKEKESMLSILKDHNLLR